MMKRFIHMVMLLLLFPVGCVHEDLSDCLEYAITLKVVDADGNDITQSGVVSVVDAYLFDEDGFVRMLPKKSGVDFQFTFDMYQGQSIVVWGNLKGDTLEYPVFSPGTPFEEAQVKLQQFEEGHHLHTTDLFHSYYRREPNTRSLATESITMVMNRTAASMDIRTLHLKDYFETQTTESFYFVVRNTSAALDFNGKSLDNDARHKPITQVDENGDLYTSSFRVFPEKEGQSVLIDICHGDEVLFTIVKDKDGNLLKTETGSHLAVLIDFLGTGLHVTVTVEPWNETGQETEI